MCEWYRYVYMLGLCVHMCVGRRSMALHLFLLRFIHFYFMYVDALPACMSVRYVRAWCSQGPEGGLRSPGAGVRETWELPFHLVFKDRVYH